MKKKKLFYVRIDIVDLLDFATDPEGESMSLLTFAKELKKQKSEYPQIQRIINEAQCYMEQKRTAGKKSAEARAKKKSSTALQRRSSGVATLPNGPSTNNSSSSITATVQDTNVVTYDIVKLENGRYLNTVTGEESDSPF